MVNQKKKSVHHPNVLMLLLSVLVLNHINTPEINNFGCNFACLCKCLENCTSTKICSHQAIFSFAETSKNLI